MLRIFTDGSWSVHTDAGGYAALLVLADGSRYVTLGGAYKTSIERMELLAMIEGLKLARIIIKNTTGKIPVVIINDREDVLRQLSGEFQSRHNLDLWFCAEDLKKSFDIQTLWMERNSHPALAQVDIYSANIRESLENLIPDTGSDILKVDVSLPETVE